MKLASNKLNHTPHSMIPCSKLSGEGSVDPPPAMPTAAAKRQKITTKTRLVAIPASDTMISPRRY